jgi:hypothetical protein
MTAHSPPPCAYSDMVQRGTFETVLFNVGSYPVNSNYTNTTYVWSGVDWGVQNNAQIDPKGPLPIRGDMAIAYDGAQVMLYGGRGMGSDAVFQDYWRFDGANWSQGNPNATCPSARYKAAAAYLSGTGAVLFGGANAFQGVLNETWVYSGSANLWTQQTPSLIVPGRINHAMATGPSYVLMFGGAGLNSVFNDTFKFSNGQWATVSPTVVPPARQDHCMAYSTLDGKFIMFGGTDAGGNYLTDCWSFDPASNNWIQVNLPPNGPCAKRGAQMSFDSISNQILMFGGIDSTTGQPSSDTWGFKLSNGFTKL